MFSFANLQLYETYHLRQHRRMKSRNNWPGRGTHRIGMIPEPVVRVAAAANATLHILCDGILCKRFSSTNGVFPSGDYLKAKNATVRWSAACTSGSEVVLELRGRAFFAQILG